MDKKSLELQRIYWNNQHGYYTPQTIKTDNWLAPFRDVIARSKGPIIDLGCGSGNNVVALQSYGKKVVACDYSESAIANIKRNFPTVEAICFDMTASLPFANDFTDLIIADLSLHYFSEQVTFRILNELRRVLSPRGTLLFRVNSMNDTNYGAGVGEEIEKHYYFTGESSYKRFYDEDDVRYFWKHWDLEYLEEKSLLRYDMPKRVWHGMAVNRG